VTTFRIFILCLGLAPGLAFATTKKAPPDKSCPEILAGDNELYLASETLLDQPIHWNLDHRSKADRSLEAFTTLLKNLQQQQLMPEELLENLDGLTQAVIFAHQWQMQKGPNEGMARSFDYLISLIRKALQTKTVSRRQLIATVRADWKSRSAGETPFGFDFPFLIDHLKNLDSKLIWLNKKPDLAADMSFFDVDDLFLMQFIREQLTDLASLKNSEVLDMKILKLDPIPSSLSLFDLWGISDRLKTRESADRAAGPWAGHHPAALKRDDFAFPSFVLQLALANEIYNQLGHPPELDEPDSIFHYLTILNKFDFTSFRKSFPKTNEVSESLYLVGAQSDFEKAIVTSVFKDPYFKRSLFSRLRPTWARDPVMQAWITIHSPAEVKDLVRQIQSESPRILQIADRYLKDSMGIRFKILADNDYNYYADEIRDVLSRVAIESPSRLNSASLRALAEEREKLKIAFFKRATVDFSLGRRTGDCTSLRSENFSRSLRWFANPEEQIVTFQVGNHFLAKAHLVLFERAGQELILMDAFEINPQAASGKPLSELFESHREEIFREMNKLGQRLHRQMVFSPICNTMSIQAYIQTFRKIDAGKLNQLRISFERNDVRALLTQISGRKIKTSASELDDSRTGEIYFQSMLAGRDFGGNFSTKNNRMIMLQSEREYEEALLGARKGLQYISTNFLFSSLDPNDRKLNEFEKLVPKIVIDQTAYETLKNTPSAGAAKFAAGEIARDMINSDFGLLDDVNAIFTPDTHLLSDDEQFAEKFLTNRLLFIYFYPWLRAQGPIDSGEKTESFSATTNFYWLPKKDH
jgi:hypothetical protein